MENVLSLCSRPKATRAGTGPGPETRVIYQKEEPCKMKKLMILMLIAAMILPCAALLAPVPARADMVYIIPDSNTRKLTYEELRGNDKYPGYTYDTLMFAFNEIYARHGYKFETGSRCYNWFTQMPWYKPNESENSKNHHETYSQCSAIENYNVDLIKQVRRDMKAEGTTNPRGKGLPTPPSRNLDSIQGFTAITLKANQSLAVYSAPAQDAYRAANGKAAVSTNGAVYAMGWDSGWLLVMYETNNGQCRIGYVDSSRIKGDIPSLPRLSMVRIPCQTLSSAGLTDDPAKTTKPLTQLPAGTTVTYLTTMYNSGEWDYIETTIDGKVARGFVPGGTLDIDSADELDAVDEMEMMEGDG